MFQDLKSNNYYREQHSSLPYDLLIEIKPNFLDIKVRVDEAMNTLTCVAVCTFVWF